MGSKGHAAIISLGRKSKKKKNSKEKVTRTWKALTWDFRIVWRFSRLIYYFALICLG